MTEAQLIHQGWTLWNADPYLFGAQWSYEEKQAMGVRKPLKINRIRQLFTNDGDLIYHPVTHGP